MSTKKTKTENASNGSYTLLGSVLNWLALVEIVIGAGLLITRIWMNKEWIGKLILTDIILFATGMFIYWLVCYKKHDA